MRNALVALTVLVSLFVVSPVLGKVHKEAAEEMDMGGEEMMMETATEGIFEGVGKVIALVPDKQQIVVGHEEIEGFMKAMPMGMGYAVADEDLLVGLEPGDPVCFKIDAAKKKIVDIEVIP